MAPRISPVVHAYLAPSIPDRAALSTIGDPQYKTTPGAGGGLSRWAMECGYFPRLGQYATNMILSTNFVESVICNSKTIFSIETRRSFEA